MVPPAPGANLMKPTLGIIGLGYVGLPMAVEFGKSFPTLGFDINPLRISELRAGMDNTMEVSPEQLAAATLLECTDDLEALRRCTIYIVTVPTPIDRYNRPDLAP
ncbi:MAG: Vi polysaccharide biosynthesis UDP-N-acetylglucosamine C-6 dehydrogenase TviB, partial [Holophaga sp.]|nr:Vi polysaccharide biosynthesis UDP-N-acetylglucosamine C-6 dehydrogenase TviB [Holophaga sp.]